MVLKRLTQSRVGRYPTRHCNAVYAGILGSLTQFLHQYLNDGAFK